MAGPDALLRGGGKEAPGDTMDVLLIRPPSGNDRFGLGPFFQVEPLGLEYVAAAVARVGGRPVIVDARFEPAARPIPARPRAGLVGISCMHAVEYDSALALARAARRAHPGCYVVVGGHAAAAYPGPLETPDIDAICLEDGEVVLPALVEALRAGRSPGEVPGLRIRTDAGFVTTAAVGDRADLDLTPRPARDLVRRYRGRYHCLLFRPVWLVETARGCPYRCSFCSVWSLYERSFRERSVGAVVDDMAEAGEHVFIVDDLFWNHPDRSLELAAALRRRGVRKRWILVQSRTDLVARHPELLAAWRPLARDFDIFFGLEAPSDLGLERLVKDTTTRATVEAAALARSLGYGVTGNFVVDPDWDEDEFRALWAFVGEHRLERAGYTILTPLPGTPLFTDHEALRRDLPWSSYDMHHLLWEPRLGPRRFFELYAETWRRSILNLQGRKRWHDWVWQVRPWQVPYLTRVLLRTQRMMRPEAYLAEHGPEWRQAAEPRVAQAGRGR
jgi:radical SAM superfamily enzyme YgiQ (UPF0313 family)